MDIALLYNFLFVKESARISLLPPFEKPMHKQFSLKNTLIYCLFFLIVPNLFFWVTSHYIFIMRGLINFDYLLLGFLIYFLPSILGYLLLLFIFIADFIFAILPGYHFADSSILKSLQHILDINLTHAYISLALVAIVLYFIFKYLKAIATRTAALVCLGMMFIIIALDFVLEKNILALENNTPIYFNMTSSGIHKFTKTILNDNQLSTPPGSHTVDAASKIIFENLSQENLPHHIVYIVVESLGEFQETAANQLQWRAFDGIKQSGRYTVHQGTVPYKGSTVPGEMRELCRRQINTVHPNPQHIVQDECLVGQLQALGYHTSAIHGFSSAFFNRFEWYPILGFDDILFIEDVDTKLSEQLRCGSTFKGACDTHLVDLVHEKILQAPHEKTFIYWLTLNTHLPVAMLENSTLDCQQSLSTQQYSDVCALVTQHDQLFSEIAKLTQDPQLPPTLFVLVGDHAPPYLPLNRRNLFVPLQVPYLILWPNS